MNTEQLIKIDRLVSTDLATLGLSLGWREMPISAEVAQVTQLDVSEIEIFSVVGRSFDGASSVLEKKKLLSLDAKFLEYLLKNQEIIPEDWQRFGCIVFFEAQFRSPFTGDPEKPIEFLSHEDGNSLHVMALCFEKNTWGIYSFWFDTPVYDLSSPRPLPLIIFGGKYSSIHCAVMKV
jgi:hypothetical protein